MATHELDYRRSMVFKSLGEEQARARFASEGVNPKELDRLAKLSRKSRPVLQEMMFQADKNMTPAKLASLDLSLNMRSSFSETNLNTSDMFSVTGKEANEAIAMSRIDGDYRRVYKAYLNNTKAGDVRDIMDVIKAQLSYSREFGLIKTNQINNLSMDMAYRLYGASGAETAEDAQRFLKTPELHTSRGDVLITENLVLKSSLAQTQALYELEQNPEQAKKVLKGFNFSKNTNLMKALRFATLMDNAQEIEQSNIEKRLYRAMEDVIGTGKTSQATNEFRLRNSERIKVDTMNGRTTMSTEQVKVAQVARYETYDNMDDVFDHIRKQGKYSEENIEVAIKNFSSRLDSDHTDLRNHARESAKGNLGPKQKVGALNKLSLLGEDLDRSTAAIFDKIAISLNTKGIDVYDGVQELTKRVNRNGVAKNYKAMDVADARILKYTGMYGAAAMAAVGFAGLAADSVFGNSSERTGDLNLRTMNYDRWLEANQQYAGLYDPTKEQDGMTHIGMGALLRKANTDFGSPYQGPTVTSFVFENQKLLREREKYTREVFSKRHFSFEGDVGSYLLGFSVNRNKHRINVAGEEVDTGHFAGLRKGGSAISLDLNKYNIEVEDADTIVLKRAGTSGFLSRMFGLNDTGSVIRLSGIDAPETAHAGRQAMAYAEMSKGALQAMLNGGNKIEVVVDPTNITYGRAMGSVFVDGENVATSLLKKGLVAHLPFYKKGSKSMQQDNIYSEYESLAQGMDYNMWGSAQYKVYEDFAKQSGKRITFNTLVNPEKVAKNGTQLSVASLMSSAEQMGFYSNLMQSEIASIAEIAKGGNMRPDWSTPILNRNIKQKSHKDYINHLVGDVKTFMTERETGITNKTSASLHGSNNKAMTLDTLGTSDSIHTNQRYKAYDLYQVNEPKRRYKRRMGEMQRQVNKNFNSSPIGHWRM